MPEHFELLAHRPEKQVEVLEAQGHPHQRRLVAVIVAGRRSA